MIFTLGLCTLKVIPISKYTYHHEILVWEYEMETEREEAEKAEVGEVGERAAMA